MPAILDLGCGTGQELLPYAKKGMPVIGIDIDQENIAVCRSIMPEGRFHIGDVTRVDLSCYPNVSHILCTEVIEHVDDWQALIRALGTADGPARLRLTTPHQDSEKKLLALRETYWEEIGHKHFFTGKEIEDELTRNGWRVTARRRWNAALHFELRSLFKRNAPCVRHTYYAQVLPLPLQLLYQLFRPNLFRTKLKWFFPIWIITLPVGMIADKFFGAGIYIEAVKK